MSDWTPPFHLSLLIRRWRYVRTGAYHCPKITWAHTQTLLMCALMLTCARVESSPASRPRHNTTRTYSAQKHTISTPRYGQYGLRMCTAISPGQWQLGTADLSSLGRIRMALPSSLLTAGGGKSTPLSATQVVNVGWEPRNGAYGDGLAKTDRCTRSL